MEFINDGLRRGLEAYGKKQNASYSYEGVEIKIEDTGIKYWAVSVNGVKTDQFLKTEYKTRDAVFMAIKKMIDSGDLE